MAEIYLGQSSGPRGYQRVAALKRILPHLAHDPSFVTMFLREARLASQLDHPNIVQVLDLGESDGEYYIAMEYVHGESLATILRTAAAAAAPIPLGVALGIVIAACSALDYAHERCDPSGRPLSIVHRDVSPSNILVRFDGHAKLADFGIAKATSQTSATRTGTLKGKAGYMSPEQCIGETIDRRSDVFALGVVLFEATTMLRFAVGDNDFAKMNRITQGLYDLPSAVVDGYPPALETIVERALAVDVQDRYGTAAELQQALETFARDTELDVSTSAVARYLRDVFGERPYPLLGSPPGSAPVPEFAETDVLATLAPTGPVGRNRTWPRVVALVAGCTALASVGGYELARRQHQPPIVDATKGATEFESTVPAATMTSAPGLESVGVPTNPAPVDVESARGEPAARAESEAPVEPATSVTAVLHPEVADVAEVADAETEPARPPKKRAKRTKRGNKARTKRRGLFPEG